MQEKLLVAAIFLGFTIDTCRAGFVSGLIDVDIDPQATPTVYTGPAVIGNLGDYWNETRVFSLSPISLNYSDGSPSSVKLTMPIHTSNGLTFGAGGYYGGSSPMTLGTYGALMGDGLGEVAVLPTVLSLTSLTPGAYYELYIYSYMDATGATLFNVNGQSATVSYHAGLDQLVEGQSYAHFAAVSASSSGEIDISVGSSGAGDSVAGFQLRPTDVPEPSSALFGLFLLIFCGWQRTGFRDVRPDDSVRHTAS